MKLRRLVVDFKAAGGAALEILNGRQTNDQSQHGKRRKGQPKQHGYGALIHEAWWLESVRAPSLKNRAPTATGRGWAG